MASIVCDVCPRACKLAEGETGFCGVRANINGENKDRLYSLVCVRSEGPTHHSLYLPGCNLQCAGCFVPFLSRYRASAPVQALPPSEAVDCAVKHQKLLSFIGGEPSLHPEYVLEASQLCRERGGVCDLYTNGYVSRPNMSALSRAVDQVHVGVKASASRRFYDGLAADPTVVLESIKTAWHENGDIWVNNLVGPGLCPTHQENVEFATWLVDNTSSEIRVLVEAMVQGLDHFPTDGYAPIPGDSRWQTFRRCGDTAWALFKSGLSNVLMVDYMTLPGGMCVTHMPSFELGKFLDFVPKRYLALDWPDRQNDPHYRPR